MSDANYIIQPLVKESPVSNPIKYRSKSDQKYYLILPGKREMSFYLIDQSGIKPDFTLNFHKTIVNLYIINDKLFLEKQNCKDDLIVVMFFDRSFIIFDDPSHVLFSYDSSSIYSSNVKSTYLNDTHPDKPYIIIELYKDVFKFWNGYSLDQRIFDIKADVDFLIKDLVDLKFLHTNKSDECEVICLYRSTLDEIKVVGFVINKDLLTLTRKTVLCRNIKDKTTRFIIPINFYENNTARFITIGSNSFTVAHDDARYTTRFISSSINDPVCYTCISSCRFMICDGSGGIHIFNIETDEIYEIAKVNIQPNFLCHIDKNIFYVGSTCNDSCFVSIEKGGTRTLSRVLNSCKVYDTTKYCEYSGCLYMAQGTPIDVQNTHGYISKLKAGKTINIKDILNVKNAATIFVIEMYIIISFFDNTSMILEKTNSKYDIKSVSNFVLDNKTLNVIRHIDKGSFIQITDHIVALCNSRDDHKLIFEERIYQSSFCQKTYKFGLLFDGTIEVFNFQFELLYKIDVEYDVTSFIISENKLILSEWNGLLHLYENNNEISKIQLAKVTLVKNMYIFDKLYIISEDGYIYVFTLPKLEEENHILTGHHVSGSFLIENNSVLLNGISPCIFSIDYGVIPFISDNKILFGSYSKEIGTVILFDNYIGIGYFTSSSVCEISSIRTEEIPLKLHIDDDENILYEIFLRKKLFGIKMRIIPSLEDKLSDIYLDDGEEATCLCYYQKEKLMLVGVSGKENGKILSVTNNFMNETRIFKFNISGGVFALACFDDLLVVGGRNKIITLKITKSCLDEVIFDIKQLLPAPTICRSLHQQGNMLIHIDSSRGITVFKFNLKNMKFEIPRNSTVLNDKINDGIVIGMDSKKILTLSGNISSQLLLHSIESHSNSLNGKLLTTLTLDSPVLSIRNIKKDCCIISTLNGGLFLLCSVSEQKYRMYHKLQNSITRYLPSCPIKEKTRAGGFVESRILNSILLYLYQSMPDNIKKKIEDEISTKNINCLLEEVQSNCTIICANND